MKIDGRSQNDSLKKILRSATKENSILFQKIEIYPYFVSYAPSFSIFDKMKTFTLVILNSVMRTLFVKGFHCSRNGIRIWFSTKKYSSHFPSQAPGNGVSPPLRSGENFRLTTFCSEKSRVGGDYSAVFEDKKNKIEIISSEFQTKKWRKNEEWYINGKYNECEIYQRKLVEKITNCKCGKTDMRINRVSKEMTEKRYPMKEIDGFDWTENFDGIIKTFDEGFRRSEANLKPRFHSQSTESHIYFNLKFICESGGSQTRSLREVYHFIENQLDYLLKEKENQKEKEIISKIENTYFVNILDGDVCNKSMDKYMYLIEREQYNYIKDNVFVGDMHCFQKWWISPSLYS